MSKKTRVAVITGASAGIGLAAAKAMAALGWRVIGLGRNPKRSRDALRDIQRHAPHARVDMVIADLAIMAEARRAADEISQLTDSVDILLNNAGGIGKELNLTPEGNEAVFAGNHLGPFLLTNELLPLLRAASAKAEPGRVRVVNVSSAASGSSSGLDWDDLQSKDNYIAYSAYANAKLANLMFTRALATRLEEDGIAVYAMHPGIADTNFGMYADADMQRTLEEYKNITVSPAEAADTLVWLSTEERLPYPSGTFFYRREPVAMNEIAEDEAETERLWRESATLVEEALT